MKQYHVLVSGFEITKTNRDGKSMTTNLRHYRYNQDAFTMKNESGSWQVFDERKTFVAGYPVEKTMVLVEDAQEREEQQ